MGAKRANLITAWVQTSSPWSRQPMLWTKCEICACSSSNSAETHCESVIILSLLIHVPSAFVAYHSRHNESISSKPGRSAFPVQYASIGAHRVRFAWLHVCARYAFLRYCYFVMYLHPIQIFVSFFNWRLNFF